MNTIKLRTKLNRQKQLAPSFKVKRKLVKYLDLTFRDTVRASSKNLVEEVNLETLAKYPDYDGTLCSLHQYGRGYFQRTHQRLGASRKYCAFTGRVRGLVSPFKMSRMVFKELSSLGLISGVKRASW